MSEINWNYFEILTNPLVFTRKNVQYAVVKVKVMVMVKESNDKPGQALRVQGG